MAKVYTGTYGKDTTDETALVTNLLKYPEIHSEKVDSMIFSKKALDLPF